MTRKLVHVAAAVIEDSNGLVFLAKRPDDKHQGGLWEFPGGKVELGETAAEALKRELLEEIGITVISAKPLITVPYHYPDKSVLLDVYHVTEFSGEAWGAEGQQTAWVDKKDLDSYPFPAANRPILNAVLLPDVLLITPECDSLESCLLGIKKAVQTHKVSAVMLRQPQLSDTVLSQWFQSIRQDRIFSMDDGKAGKRAPLLIINSSLELANQLEAPAVHLSSSRLKSLTSRSVFAGRWLSASCHNQEELDIAAQTGCDFVTLSPVQKTNSHPLASPLGWGKAADLAGQSPLPIYMLGGLSSQDREQAKKSGAQGIAAISALWT